MKKAVTTTGIVSTMLLITGSGLTTIPEDFEEQNILADDDKLGADFYNTDGKGAILLSHLKKVVTKYNSTAENKIPVDHFQLDKMKSYTNFVILNHIVQLQMFLATNENKMTVCR
jgi:hypothetical protein